MKSQITFLIIFMLSIAMTAQNYESTCVYSVDSILDYRNMSCNNSSVGVTFFKIDDNEPIKTIRLNFFFFQKQNGKGNFEEDNPEHQQYLNDFIDRLNYQYSNIVDAAPACYTGSWDFVPDSKIRFKVHKFYIRNEQLWDNNNSEECPFQYNWYLTDFQQSVEDTMTKPAINVYFTEYAEAYNQIVLQQNYCFSSWATGDCAWSPSYNLSNIRSAVHMRNEFIKFNSMKYCATQQYNQPWENGIVYNWLVDGQARGLGHELIHNLGLWHIGNATTCLEYISNHYYGPRNYFKPEEIARIHRNAGVMNLRNFIECKTPSEPNLSINSNITFDFDVRFYRGITIEEDITLLITCKLLMPPNSNITVKKGGKLVVDEAVITSSCSSLWQGIIAEPGATVEIINGGTIENAITGIEAQGNAIVKADEGNFTNNKIAVHINGTGNLSSYIRKSNFTTTDYLSTLGEHPEQFIFLDGASKLNIQGNTFKNNNPGDYEINERGIGIRADNSGLTVKPYCSSVIQVGEPCLDETPSSFENLYYGIYIDNYDGYQRVNIDRNQFVNNTRGVYLFGSHNSIVTRNNFIIGEPISDEIYVDNNNNVNNNLAYGIYSQYATSFKYEDNYFTTEKINQGIVGLIIDNSGSGNNEFYHNTFGQIPYSAILQGVNANHSVRAQILTGLTAKCNIFDKNLFDIAVVSDRGALKNQGSSDKPAGNVFSQLCVSNNNDIYDGYLCYYYHLGNPSMVPKCFSSEVSIQPSTISFTTMDAVCPSHFGTIKPPLSEINTRMAEADNSATQLNTQYINLVDGNNTSWLLKKIRQNHNPANMKTKLLEVSPWLSDEVMVSLIGQENYFAPGDLTEVLVSNPQSATSKDVQESLDNMTTPLPYSLRTQINTNTATSPKSEMEARLSTQFSDREYYANEIVNYYLEEDTPESQTALAGFLASQNTLEYDYKLISYYYTAGQTTEAGNLLTQLPAKYSLDTYQQSYYDKYRTVYEILLNLKENNLSFADMNLAQEQTLRGLSQEPDDLPGSIAKKIICGIDGVPYVEWVKLPYEIIAPSNPISGILYESAECGGNPYKNDTLIIISENGDTLQLMPAITDNYGFFQFDETEIAALDPAQVVTLATLSGYKLQEQEYKTIEEWKQSSPVTLALANSNPEWADLYSNVDSLFNGGTVLDLNGNLYVAGYTRTPTGLDDMLVIKYNPAGERIWVKTYNGTASSADRAVDIAVDGDNNCYVLGNSNGTNTMQDIVVVKYDSDGNQIWEKRVNGTANSTDEAKTIGIDASNNVYITGTVLNNSTGNDIITIKYSKTGQLKWQKTYATPNIEYATEMKIDNAGNVIVTGFGTDYITLKYNTNGTQLWQQQYDGGYDDVAYGLAVDAVNNIFVTGVAGNNITTVKYNSTGIKQWDAQYTVNAMPSDITADDQGNAYIAGASNLNAILIKYSPAGQQEWVQVYNSNVNGVDGFLAITADLQNNIYVTGHSGTRYGLIKNTQIITAKYDETGERMWIYKHPYSSLSPNRGNDIVVSENNNVYVTGTVFENSIYQMVTIKMSQCPSSANLKSAAYKPEVTANNETVEEIEDDELIQVINFKENKVIVYPNPYTENTRIELITNSDAQVALEVYTMGGQLIENIYSGYTKQGKYDYTFSAKTHGYSAGTYVLKITINNEVNSYWLVEMK